jgi:hypothetical protein
MHRRRRGWSSWRSRWRRGRRCVDLHLYTFACSSHGAARRCLTIGSQWVQIPRHGDPIVTVTSMAPTLTSEVLVCDERADCFRASQWAAAGCNQRRTHWALPSLKQPKADRHRNTTKPARLFCRILDQVRYVHVQPATLRSPRVLRQQRLDYGRGGRPRACHFHGPISLCVAVPLQQTWSVSVSKSRSNGRHTWVFRTSGSGNAASLGSQATCGLVRTVHGTPGRRDAEVRIDSVG